ncbi:MAG TPA: HAD hydrolase-like protein, partial [Candidatus Elarobacter sp.]
MTILFDLDGTLTDPYLGISRCIEYALGAIDSSVPDGTDLSTFIGPPLRGTLLALCGDEERAGRALAAYRERFAATGLYENVVYQGVPAMLDDLRGHRLYVCTAKPAVYAKRIVEYFGLSAYFAGVYGCELDGTRGEKADLIAWLLEREGLESAACVMVGDRSHDMVAAARNGVRGLGALWGYGSEAELTQAGAVRTFRSPAELAAWFGGLGPEPSGSVYGAAARRYAAHSLTSPHNALYERPAMEALIG